MSGNAEQLAVLGDAARGLLARVGGVKRALSAPGSQPLCLTDSAFKQMRKGIERSFPDFHVEGVRGQASPYLAAARPSHSQ